MKTTFNYQVDVLKVYWEIYKAKYTYNYLIYGRDSGKTRFMPYLLLTKFLKHEEINVIVIRKHQNSLKRSCFEAIRREIYRRGLENEFDFRTSELQIEDKTNGSQFYFFGMDDENKIRSTIMKNGFPCVYWVEEWQEFKTGKELEDLDEMLTTFIREKIPKHLKHQAYFTGNKPREKHDPRNLYLQRKREFDPEETRFWYAEYTDMVDNETQEPLLSDQEIRRIKRFKERDYETYLHRWKGISIGSNKEVYNMDLIKIVGTEGLPNDERLKYFDVIVDGGYQVSATTFIALGITNKENVVLLDVYYFSPDKDIFKRFEEDVLRPHSVAYRKEDRKAPSEFALDLHTFVQTVKQDFNIPIDDIVIDSAEGALRNEYYRKYGEWLIPINKKDKETMIEYSNNLIVEKDVYVYDRPRNKIFIHEMQKYRRDEKPSGKMEIIKTDDHTVDCFQYFATRARYKIMR